MNGQKGAQQSPLCLAHCLGWELVLMFCIMRYQNWKESFKSSKSHFLCEMQDKWLLSFTWCHDVSFVFNFYIKTSFQEQDWSSSEGYSFGLFLNIVLCPLCQDTHSCALALRQHSSAGWTGKSQKMSSVTSLNLGFLASKNQCSGALYRIVLENLLIPLALGVIVINIFALWNPVPD